MAQRAVALQEFVLGVLLDPIEPVALPDDIPFDLQRGISTSGELSRFRIERVDLLGILFHHQRPHHGFVGREFVGVAFIGSPTAGIPYRSTSCGSFQLVHVLHPVRDHPAFLRQGTAHFGPARGSYSNLLRRLHHGDIPRLSSIERVLPRYWITLERAASGLLLHHTDRLSSRSHSATDAMGHGGESALPVYQRLQDRVI